MPNVWQIWQFLTIIVRGPGRNGLKFGMMIYPDHLLYWLDFGKFLLILFHLCWTGFYFGFRNILENECCQPCTVNVSNVNFTLKNAWKEWPQISHIEMNNKVQSVVTTFYNFFRGNIFENTVILQQTCFSGLYYFSTLTLRPDQKSQHLQIALLKCIFSPLNEKCIKKYFDSNFIEFSF